MTEGKHSNDCVRAAIVRPDTRRAVVFRASSQNGGVERKHLLAGFDGESNVNGARAGAKRAEPELPFTVLADHCPALTFGDNTDTKRSHGLNEERFARRKVTNIDTDWSRIMADLPAA
ncbi:MAG: hypothetical protein H0V62_14190 [Gammaproteobacteria bacterium]|nr:hypothetical protein [Gammaproteobacteria bacterium]